MMETVVYRNNAKASVSAGLEAPEAAVATATRGTQKESSRSSSSSDRNQGKSPRMR